MMKLTVFLIGAFWCLSGPMVMAAPPPECTNAILVDAVHINSISFGSGSRAAWLPKHNSLEMPFEPPVLSYPFGSLNVYGFELTFVVDTAGKIECTSLKPAYKSEGPAINPVRQRFLEAVSAWQFKPFVVDGKPVRVTASLSIDEEEQPQTHAAKPEGDPAQVTITQDNWPWIASFRAYHVELHGDGTAIYTPRDPADPLGPQSYHVDPKAVQALVAKAEKADFWSLRDQYQSPNAGGKDWLVLQRLNVTIGGKTKSLTDMNGDQAGMSKRAEMLQNDVMSAANIDFWQTPGIATLEQLKANGFDFRSARGGYLLLMMMQNRNVKDEAVVALMDLGAPLDAEDNYNNETLIEAALRNARTGIGTRLIAAGALMTEGKPDQVKINWAFYAALEACKTNVFDLILPLKPDLTYTDYAHGDEVTVSVIRKLGGGDLRDACIPIAERLLAMGADINAHTANGSTLLHEFSLDQAFASFLLSHGANVNAITSDGQTALGNTYDEDMALMFLENKADPRLGQTGKHLRFNISKNHWVRLKLWLQTHDYADVLVVRPDDETPELDGKGVATLVN
jgi:hypothetical protein